MIDDIRYRLENDTDLLDTLARDASLRTYACNFLLYGGVLAGHADGQLDEDEIDYLADALSPLMSDSRMLVAAVHSPQIAVESLEDSMNWLRENGGPVRMDLLRCLSGIVAADDVLDPDERRFIMNVADEMGIPSQVALEILENAFVKPA